MTIITERRIPRIVPPLAIESNPTTLSNRSDEKSIKICSNSSDKENSKKVVTKEVATLATTSNSGHISSRNTINFLTGRQMTKQQEIDALQELKYVSPTNSLIETLSENILKVPKTFSFENNCSGGRRTEENVCNKIDSIKIYIDSLVLSKAGIREVKASVKNDLLYSNDVTFIVECKLNPNNDNLPNSKRSKWKYEFDVIRVTSGCKTDFTSSKYL